MTCWYLYMVSLPPIPTRYPQHVVLSRLTFGSTLAKEVEEKAMKVEEEEERLKVTDSGEHGGMVFDEGNGRDLLPSRKGLPNAS